MINFYPRESYKELKLKGRTKNMKKYAVTNYGRVFSYDNKPKEGHVLKSRDFKGYPTIHLRTPDSSGGGKFIHRIVAENFVKKASNMHKFVIHKDFDKENNHYLNLAWVTQEGLVAHNKKNPTVIAAAKRQGLSQRGNGHVLTNAKVKEMKLMLASKNRKLTIKQIAKKYKISEMQVYRIKSGENWGHVKIKK